MTEANANSGNNNACGLAAYRVGDSDVRPWGTYAVTGVGILDNGKEYCEKIITVNPGKILSLQSHDHRAERWEVREGTLTVILDGRRITLYAGDTVDIPLYGIHCMANLTEAPCKVYEIQTGLCREEDIVRYLDAYGRETKRFTGQAITASIALYREVLGEIEEMERRAA